MEEDTPQEPQPKYTYAVGAIALLIISAGIGVSFFELMHRSTLKPSPVQAALLTSTLPTGAHVSPVTAISFKDGTYTASGEYTSPGGAQSIDVILTLKRNIITDSTVTPGPTDMMSAKYQDTFVAHYKPMVIGKNISGLMLGKVSRSSLTPKGFNDALQKIKDQAKV